jgi:hypothetical protein
MQILLGLAIGLVFFVATITAYSFGVKHGRIVKNDGIPNVNPVKTVKVMQKKAEEEKKSDEIAQGLSNILSYGD